MKNFWWLWILFIAAIFLYTFNLGEFPLRDWDEGIVATVAREIYRANPGDFTWLYPHNIDGSPYWNKPPLIHSLIALSYKLFGVNEWSTRLIPSILAALCVPLIYSIGKEVFNTNKEALFSALVYLILIPVVRHNRLAMLDGAVTFEFCLSIWCLLKLRSYCNSKAHKEIYRQLCLLGIGLSFGLLCLTKGVAIAFLLSLITILFILSEIKTFSPLFSLPAILIICLGISPAIIWYGLQYLHYGQEFIDYNLGTQTFNRVINAVENNSQPVWYYLLELIKYSLPWLIFLPGGIKLAIQESNRTWAKLSLIWFSSYLLVISFMTTKLPWYVMPIYPAFALLVGAKLNQIVELQQARKFKKNVYRLWLLLLSIIFWLATIYFSFLNDPRDVDLILIAITLAVTFTIATLLIQSSSFIIALVLGLYLALLNLFNTPHSIWELAEAYPVKPVAKLIRETVPSKTTIYTSYPYYRPSLNFYSDRLIIPLAEEKLPEVLLTENKVYLLISKDSPPIPNSKIINETETWQILVNN